jgi:hypothetical protein
MRSKTGIAFGILAAGFVTASLSVGAYGADSTDALMADYYGNTIMAVRAGESEGRFWYNKDGTLVHTRVNYQNGSVTVNTPNGPKTINGGFVVIGEYGTWSIQGEGDKALLCRNIPDTKPVCNPFRVHKLGEVFHFTYPNGDKEDFSLVKGHV